MTDSSVVVLNVGGKRFATSKRTLLMDNDSMLAAMFDPERGHCAEKQDDDSFFIDRDPKYFRPILNFLRTNKVHIDKNVSCSGVLEEAIYFNIIPMQLAIFEKYQLDQFIHPDFTSQQLDSLRELKQSIHEGQEQMKVYTVRPPTAAVASSKGYIEPKRIRAEITRKELVQMISTTGIDTRLRLSGICFAHQDLSGLDLGNCNLSGSDFSYCNLERVTFYNSTLSKCCFRNANFQHSNCNDANFVGADLRDADLRWARFCHSDLMASNLTGAVMDNKTQLNGCIMRNVIGLTEEQKAFVKEQGVIS